MLPLLPVFSCTGIFDGERSYEFSSAGLGYL